MEPIRKPSDLPGDVRDEEDEALSHRRQQQVREMTWEHLQATHQRFLGYQDRGDDDNAYAESNLFMVWLDRWDGTIE